MTEARKEFLRRMAEDVRVQQSALTDLRKAQEAYHQELLAWVNFGFWFNTSLWGVGNPWINFPAAPTQESHTVASAQQH